MRTSFRKTAIAAAAVATALLCASPAAAAPTSIRGLATQEARLATIAYRIGAASADSCPAREMMTGLVLHDLTRYDQRLRPAVSRAFSMSSGFGILAVVPHSVSAQAGLQVDDEILAVDRLSVEDTAASTRASKSYQRMEQFFGTLEAGLTDGQAELLIRRRGDLLRVTLRGQAGCGGKLTLTNSSAPNAWSDGTHVVLTTGMTGLARSDDEIAFVIAHEMAHNILGHSRKASDSRGIFGAGFSNVKRGEIEADTYAVRLMTDAGYEAAGGISFLENASRRLWWNISLDHPGFGRRMKIVAAAMAANRSGASQVSSAAGQAADPELVQASVSRSGEANGNLSMTLVQLFPGASEAQRLDRSCQR